MDDVAAGLGVQSMTLDIPFFAGKTFHVIRMSGEEAVSTPYAFEVEFTCPEVLDGAGAVGKPVTLTVQLANDTFIAAGVIVRFRSDDPTPLGDFAYHVRI